MGASSTVQSTLSFVENVALPVVNPIGGLVYHGTKAAKEFLIDEPAKAREDAKKRGDAQIAQQERILEDQKATAEKTKKQNEVRKRRIDTKTLYAGTSGATRSGTIATSPLGVPGSPSGGGGKTLIGS